ncbi:MAG: CTP synthetase, partial [Deltaproteobacteria bacterium]
VELPGHPFFLACQFHPEFTSRPLAPHPLFVGFIRAALAHRRAREEKGRSGEERPGPAAGGAAEVRA